MAAVRWKSAAPLWYTHGCYITRSELNTAAPRSLITDSLICNATQYCLPRRVPRVIVSLNFCRTRPHSCKSPALRSPYSYFVIGRLSYVRLLMLCGIPLLAAVSSRFRTTNPTRQTDIRVHQAFINLILHTCREIVMSPCVFGLGPDSVCGASHRQRGGGDDIVCDGSAQEYVMECMFRII